MNINEKLSIIQSNLKVQKNNFNAFGKYKYRSCEDILEAVKPYLTETKTALVLEDTIELVGERYYVKAIASLMDCECEANKTISINTTAYAREESIKKGMDEAQVTGSASSYARKYALNGLLCIDDTKDSDSTNKHGKEEDPPFVAPKISVIQATSLETRLTSLAIDGAKFLEHFNVSKLTDMTVEQFSEANILLNKKELKA